jgi:WXG100 family type VII secretion target
MAQILVTPENVEKTGNDIIAKKQELEDIIKRAKQMIDGLRGEFKGNLATQVFGKWDEVYPSFSKTFDNLQAAGDVLKKAAGAFRQVDETKLS